MHLIEAGKRELLLTVLATAPNGVDQRCIKMVQMMSEERIYIHKIFPKFNQGI